MNKKLNNKAAMELSLNLIIMLIIGMVVLGLVIGFVNSLVNKGKGTFENQIGEQDQLKLDEVSNCRDNLCAIPSASLTIEKGKDTKIYFKVRNYKNDGDIDCNAGPLISGCGIEYKVVDKNGNTATDLFEVRGQGFIGMKAGEEASRMYVMATDSTQNVETGTYYATFGIGTNFENPIVLTITVE